MIPRTTFIAILALLAHSAGAGSQELRACAVAPQKLQAAVQRHLRANVDPGAAILHLHLPCGTGAVYVAAAWLPSRDREGDYGPRIVTLERSSAGWTLVAVLPGLSDSHLPELQLFASPERTLVLADLGDEGGSWGVGTYEVVGRGLVELGLLDVGRPTDENDQSALDDVMVRHADGRWQVSFVAPIVLRPNQASRQVVVLRDRARIDFRFDGETWRRRP